MLIVSILSKTRTVSPGSVGVLGWAGQPKGCLYRGGNPPISGEFGLIRDWMCRGLSCVVDGPADLVISTEMRLYSLIVLGRDAFELIGSVEGAVLNSIS